MNSPSFHLVPQHCRDVTIDGVTITAPADSPNTDAIDPSGWNFLITRCRIDVGDDNIAVKAGKGTPPEGKAASCGNFTVTSCTFLHGHGLSIGSETDGGLDGMRVSDCSFEGTTAGIRMKSNREKGGVVQNLSYDRITMKNVNTPVQITSYYPKTPSNPAEEDSLSLGSRTPVWKNITISNLKAVDSTNAGILWGLPKIPITDVTFKNVEIEAVTGMTILNAKGIRFDQSSIAVQKGKKLTTTNADVSGL
jgi:polygalacturonase